jgi:PKD repeat protein
MTGDAGGGTASSARAQSEVVGVVLVTGIVLLLAVGAGAVVVSNVLTQSQDVPSVDVEGQATTAYVTLEHAGGDSVATSSVAVVLDARGRTRYPLDSFTQRVGDDPSRFEPGDTWRRINDVGGDSIRVLVVHEPTNTVLDEERFAVETTLAAGFTYSPSNPTPTDAVTFDAGRSDVEPGGSIVGYEWDFDDDGTVDATGRTATYGFPDDGTFPVALTVEAGDGRTVTRTRTVTVYNQFPDAAFTFAPSNPRPGQVVDFDATSSTDPDGTVAGYEWDLDGDGTVDATGERTSFSYGTAGNYTVRLNVTDDDGAFGRRSKVVRVGTAGRPLTGLRATSVVPYADSQYQTLAFTVGTPLAGGETVTVDLGGAQSTSPLRVNYGSAGVVLLDGPGGSSPQFVTQNADDAAVRYYAPSGGLPAGERVSLRVTGVDAGRPPDQRNPYTATFTRSDGASGTDAFAAAYDDGDAGLSAVGASNFTTDAGEQTVAVTLDSDLAQGERVTVDLSDAQRADGSPPKVDYGSASAVVDSGSGSVQFQEQGTDDANLYYTAGASDAAGDRVEIRLTGVQATLGPNSRATYTAGFSRGDADTVSTTFTVTKSGGSPGDGPGDGTGPPCDGPSNAPQCR